MWGKLLYIISGVILIGHGSIHLIGVGVYLRLAEIEGLTYKTTLLGGRWDLGTAGIGWFGGLWLVPVLGFVISAIGKMTKQDWWCSLILATTLFSLVITVLDYQVAYAGVLVNLLILAGLYIAGRMKLRI